jgi:hypothetical protein
MAFLGSSAQPYKDILICQVETRAASRPWARAAGTGPRPERSHRPALGRSHQVRRWVQVGRAREPPPGAGGSGQKACERSGGAGRQVPTPLAGARVPCRCRRARRLPAFIRALLVVRHDRATARRAPCTHSASGRTGTPATRSLWGEGLAKRWRQNVICGGGRRRPPGCSNPPTKAVSTVPAWRNLCAGGGLSREQQQQTEIAS